MGYYINKGNNGFREARNSEYVDKSGLIREINATIGTKSKFSCISRCRRFGKSMAAEMLTAYYDQSCDSRQLFEDLAIASDPSFEKHLNKYPVIYVDMTGFVTRFRKGGIIEGFKKRLLDDIQNAYPDFEPKDDDDFMDYLMTISESKGQKFILIIDEWDAVLREFGDKKNIKDDFVDLLRRMFKDTSSEVFAAVYMTGILPIKKYKTQSALNNFIEYSMTDPANLAPYYGFTKDEMRTLAERHNMDFDELEKWYDGYCIGDEPSMFNPNSVMQAIRRRRCQSYWGQTASYDMVTPYISMNFNGLKDDILAMLAGMRVKVNVTKFQNDLSTVKSKDDVLTVLIHLGYLAYNWTTKECHVPNREVADELVNAVEESKWGKGNLAFMQSEELLQSTLDCDEEAVARGIDAVHDENTSILSYNNENSLACVISIAYYYAKNDYIIFRELPTGKGFADMVFIPRKNISSPTLIIELKYNKDADAAIDQIKRKNYPAKLADYAGNLLLVGINYDKKTKTHTCHIVKA